MSITYGEIIPKIMDSFYTNISKPKKLTTVFYIDPFSHLLDFFNKRIFALVGIPATHPHLDWSMFRNAHNFAAVYHKKAKPPRIAEASPCQF